MITSTTTDSAGRNVISSDTIIDSQYVDVESSLFSNPASDTTAYVDDGLKRNAGILDSSDRASWSSESGSSNRGDLNRFPERIFIITDTTSVNILDADNLVMWMRFVPGKTPTKVVFSEGYLLISFSDEVRIYSFTQDKFWHLTSTSVIRYDGVSFRNNPGGTTSTTIKDGSSANITLLSNVVHTADIRKVLSRWLVCIGQDIGMVCFDINSLPTTNVLATEFVKHTLSKGVTATTKIELRDSSNLVKLDQVVPYNPSPVDYISNSIKRGDLIKITAPVAAQTDNELVHKVTPRNITFRNDGTALSLPQDILVSPTPVQFTIFKPVNLCKIDPSGKLFFAAGHNLHISITNWIDGSLDVFNEKSSESPIDLDLLSEFFDCHLIQDNLYIASSVGLLKTNQIDIESGNNIELTYSAFYSSSARYPGVFAETVDDGFGNQIPKYTWKSVGAVSQDPENGNLVLSSGSIIFEIQQGMTEELHILVRALSQSSTVNTIAGFRNPNGIPEV